MVIYTFFPPPIHILSLQVDFIQTQTLRKHKTKVGGEGLNHIKTSILKQSGVCTNCTSTVGQLSLQFIHLCGADVKLQQGLKYLPSKQTHYRNRES